jgi:hypothetical protein
MGGGFIDDYLVVLHSINYGATTDTLKKLRHS